MLRRVFARRRAEALATVDRPLGRVLVIIGGTDSRELTGAIVRELLACLPEEVEVRIAGSKRGPIVIFAKRTYCDFWFSHFQTAPSWPLWDPRDSQSWH